MPALERHPSLVAFSRDHQFFMLEVQQIRWLIEGDERAASLDDVVGSLLSFWKTHGEAHVREEEEILFPFYLAKVPSASEEIESLITDHNWLRDKFEELASLPRYENCAPIMQSMAEYMTYHIRQEERGLYENIQSQLDAATLLQLEQALALFRAKQARELPDKADLPNLDEL